MKKKIFLILLLVMLGCGKEKVDVDLDRPLVVLGDSLATGYGSSKGFPYYLRKELNMEVINLGINGETTSNSIKRIDDVVKHDPSIVIIELGGNDFLKRIPISETEMNLKAIVEELNDGKRTIFLTEFYPRNKFLSLFMIVPKKEYEDMFVKISEDENVYILENIWKNVWGKEMSDGVHPNSKGYEIMGTNMLKSMKKVLSSETFKED